MRVATEIIPVADTMRQLILALGAALLVGNLAVIVRERFSRRERKGPGPNWKVVGLNITVGTILTVWGLASLLVAS